MDRGTIAERLLLRLETAADAIVADREQVVLAFSAGLRSLVVAAVLRKRTELKCVVAGARGAADVVESGLAKDYLDYDVHVVPLSPSRVLSLARDIASEHLHLPPGEVLDLVPLSAVRSVESRGAIVTGCHARSLPANLAKSSRLAPLELPLSDVLRVGPIRRAELRALGRHLSIPESFLRVRARPPASGSGVASAVRSYALDRQTSIRSLLRPRQDAPR